MCGIAGYECKDKYDERLSIAIPILAMHMEQRGRVSWGWTDGNTEVVKSMGEISKGFNPSFFGYKQAALHTRQPTTGARVKENSHPFKIGNIIGMHNGMVRNHDELQKKYDRKCEVDSEHIFHHLAEGKSLNDIIGYGAIVFYKDGVLHLGRFNGGSLVLVKTSIGWLFASTKEALEVALQYSGLREGAIFFKLKEDRLYKLVNGQLEKDMKLNFGSYNTQEYGTWENNKWVPKGGGRSASTFSGAASSTYVGIQYGTTKYYDKDGEYVIETINNKKYKVHGHGQGRLLTAIEDTPAGMAARSHSGKKKVGASEVNNRIADMLIAATAAKTQKKERTADEFPCEYCNDMIKQGELFGMLDQGQVLCQYCCCSYAEPGELIDDILADTLPLDVMLVEAFFAGDHDKPEEKVINCDDCNDKLVKDDWFALALNQTFLCLQCFMEKYKKTTVEELEQEDAAIAFPGVTSSQVPDDDELAIFNQQITESLDQLRDVAQDKIAEEDDNVIPFRTQQIM